MRKVVAILVLCLVVVGYAAADVRLQVAGQDNATPTPTAASQGDTAITATVASQPGSGAVNETWTRTYIAQQNLQRGYMFWISTNQQIWVLVKADENATSGEWRAFSDTFAEGEPETDPSLTPPDLTNTYQPRRGFGKIWRDTPGLREALGWGTTPEFDLSMPMGYLSTPTLSRYLITTLGQELFALYETTPGTPGGRWEMVGRVITGNQIRMTTTPQATTASASTQAATQPASEPAAATESAATPGAIVTTAP
jgi:hypothetical protein